MLYYSGDGYYDGECHSYPTARQRRCTLFSLPFRLLFFLHFSSPDPRCAGVFLSFDGYFPDGKSKSFCLLSHGVFLILCLFGICVYFFLAWEFFQISGWWNLWVVTVMMGFRSVSEVIRAMMVAVSFRSWILLFAPRHYRYVFGKRTTRGIGSFYCGPCVRSSVDCT